MTGSFPALCRIGGKRAVAAHVLDILGTWPTCWLMVDADVAIVELWQAAFGGWLPAVAQIIRDAPCDGEELWKLWMSEPVPTDQVERLARWVVGQKGNFSGKPLSYGNKWEGVAGYSSTGFWAGGGAKSDNAADSLDTFWEGVAGYASLSGLAVEKGFADRVVTGATAHRLDDFAAGPGSAVLLDLATSSPVFRLGDLVTIDPPYQGTTGYGSALDRARVVELAEEAHACGCRVLIHEAEPVLTGAPWHSVELERRHGANQDTWRKGRKGGEAGERRREWVTVNWEPCRTVHFSMAPTRTFSFADGPLFADVVDSKEETPGGNPALLATEGGLDDGESEVYHRDD